MSPRKKSALPDNLTEITDEHNKSSARQAQAFRRLGVSSDDVNKVPKISHILKKIKGGTLEAIELLRHSRADEAKEFFKVYEELPEYLSKILPIEAFCFAAGVDSRAICEIIFDQALEQSNQAARMLTAVSLEELVQTSIEVGMSPLGIKDRENLQKAVGFLPVPDGMKINILNQNNSTATASAQAAAAATLPPAEDTIRRMSNRFNERFIGSETPQAALSPAEEEEEFIPASHSEPSMVERESHDKEECD